MRILVDPVTFLADYPSASLSDVYGHQGNTFCTHCTSTKGRAQGSWKIVGLPMNYSRSIGLTRTDTGMAAIRNGNLQPCEYLKLGMNIRTLKKAEQLRLVHLSINLDAVRSDNEGPACNFVAPRHVRFAPKLPSCAGSLD